VTELPEDVSLEDYSDGDDEKPWFVYSFGESEDGPAVTVGVGRSLNDGETDMKLLKLDKNILREFIGSEVFWKSPDAKKLTFKEAPEFSEKYTYPCQIVKYANSEMGLSHEDLFMETDEFIFRAAVTWETKNKNFTASDAERILMSLESVEQGEKEKYETYANARFGYSLDYPDIFDTKIESDNVDGVAMESSDGKYALTVWGSNNINNLDGEAMLNECKERVSHIVPDSEYFYETGYYIQYSDDGGQDGVEHIFFENGFTAGDMSAAFILKFPKDEEKRFEKIIDVMSQWPAGYTNPAGEPDVYAFSLKGGRVYKGGKEIDCEVNEISPETEGSLRYWSVIGPDKSDAVTEKETGVWFFAEGGAFMTFLPLESEYGCQDVIFSPDESYFLLMDGSGVRPDMFYILYDPKTMKEKVEITGVRGTALWIDVSRFVVTRIDDIREGGRFLNLGYGLCLSAVMYDTVTEETFVLKEATATKNFWCGELTDDGTSLVIREDSVKSEKDWDDEEKIKTREIKIEIPPAG
jgi:hypothetical protein